MITIVLLIFMGGSILAVVFQIIQERKCMTDLELKKFYNGSLKKDDASYRRFIAHLGICEKCQKRLHSYDDDDDDDKLDEHFIEKGT